MKACYPGTFDPITNGHIDIIARAAQMFDEVVVLIMHNPSKKCLFSEEERKHFIEQSIAELPNADKIKVMIGSGLTVNYAASIGASAIIRGIRAVSDYEYELMQATANLHLNDKVETLLLIARPEYSFLSSSIVKEIAFYDGDISAFIPDVILDEIHGKLTQKQ
jgi:pantetheine-phosphate adenylyltransferase